MAVVNQIYACDKIHRTVFHKEKFKKLHDHFKNKMNFRIFFPFYGDLESHVLQISLLQVERSPNP